MADLTGRLTRCFQAVFEDIDPAEIPHATAETVASWDSLATATLMTVVEEEFGVQVAPEDLPRFVSYPAILGFLRERLES
jgi:acyl carrier protein